MSPNRQHQVPQDPFSSIATQPDSNEEDSKLSHTAKLIKKQQGVGMNVAVVAHDVDSLLSNLQHVIRGYAKQALLLKRFTGSVTISVDIQDPAYEAQMKEHLLSQLEDMSQFLSNQFVNLGMVCANQSPIQLACSIDNQAY